MEVTGGGLESVIEGAEAPGVDFLSTMAGGGEGEAVGDGDVVGMEMEMEMLQSGGVESGGGLNPKSG